MSGLTPETLSKLNKLVEWWNTNPDFEGLRMEPLKFDMDSIKFTVWEDMVEWEHIE